ncbi:MAG: hypothetical protein NTW86_12770 [Candidatus Sumerlaeota bacterium]|nr:hypothetical protein [Candidatus Sumerlaeota bacterium]
MLSDSSADVKARRGRRRFWPRRWRTLALLLVVVGLYATLERWSAWLIEVWGGRRLNAVLRIGRLEHSGEGEIRIDDFLAAPESTRQPALVWRTGVFRYDSLAALWEGRFDEVFLKRPTLTLGALREMYALGAFDGQRHSLEFLLTRLPAMLSVSDGRVDTGEASYSVPSLTIDKREIPSSGSLLLASARLLGEDWPWSDERSGSIVVEARARVLGDSIQGFEAGVQVAGRQTLRGTADMSDWCSLPSLTATLLTNDFSTSEALRRIAPQWLPCVGGLLRDGRFVWTGRFDGQTPRLCYQLTSNLLLEDGFLRSPNGRAGIEGLNQDLSMIAEFDRDLRAQRLNIASTGTLGSIHLPRRDFPGAHAGVVVSMEPIDAAWRVLGASFLLSMDSGESPSPSVGALQLAARGTAQYETGRHLVRVLLDSADIAIRSARGAAQQTRLSGSFQMNLDDPEDPANVFQGKLSGAGHEIDFHGSTPTGPSCPFKVETKGARLESISEFLRAMAAPALPSMRGILEGWLQAFIIPGENARFDFDARIAGFGGQFGAAGRVPSRRRAKHEGISDVPRRDARRLRRRPPGGARAGRRRPPRLRVALGRGGLGRQRPGGAIPRHGCLDSNSEGAFAVGSPVRRHGSDGWTSGHRGTALGEDLCRPKARQHRVLSAVRREVRGHG